MASVKQESEGVNQETEDVNQLAAAFTPCLPQVYLVSLLSLINEVVKPETAQTLEVSLPLLLPHLSNSKARLAAFLHQSLSALGCKEEVDKLKAEADQTFSLQPSYPNLWSMAEEKKNSIHREIASIGTSISSTLLDFYFQLVRLSLLYTLLPYESDRETFYQMFNRLLTLKQSLSEAASIIHSILMYFRCNDVNVPKLEPYVIPRFSLHHSYPEIFLKLRVAEFLCNIGEDNCILAMMLFSQQHLNNEAIDRYSPLEFIGLIFLRGKGDVARFNELAMCFNLSNYFEDTPSITSEDFFTPLTTPILPRHRATPTNEERPGVSTQDAMKARMKFMITAYHPEEDDFTRLNEFMTQLAVSRSPSFTLSPTLSPALSATPVGRIASTDIETQSVRSSINNNGVDAPNVVDPIEPVILPPPTIPFKAISCDCMKKHKKKKILVIILLLAFILSGGAAIGIHFIPHLINNPSTPKNTTLLGTNDNPVLLDTSSNSNCLEIYGPVNVYRVPSDNLTTSYAELPPTNYPPPSPNPVECVPQNYHHSQDPINLAPQSQLLYNVTIQEHLPTSEYNSSLFRKDDCVRIYIVNSREAYDQLTPNDQVKLDYCDTEGIHIVYQSECMDLRPNETKSVWLVVFNVTEQADYYVVLETSGRYAYNTTITGTQVTYEVFNNERICTPSLSNRTCVTTSCDYSFPYYEACPDAFSSNEGGSDSFSYLIQSSDFNDVSVNISSIKKLSGSNCAVTMMLAAASFFGAVLLFVCLILCCCCWCQNENSKNRNNRDYRTFRNRNDR